MALHDVIAIILGGGQGSRLHPLTKLRAKPAVPLAGKYRLIDIPLSNCINSGVDKVFVLTQFLSASLHRHLHQTYQFDAFSHGFVDLLAADQTPHGNRWYQGTADAVRHQMRHFRSRPGSDALILAGDHLYRMDYAPFVRFHRETHADVTLACLPIRAEDTGRFGVLKLADDGRIVNFREKPSGEDELRGLESGTNPQRPYMGSMGIYLFRMEALSDLLERIPEDDFGRHIIPAAIEEAKVFGYPFDGYWEDIGTIGTFFEANLALTRPDPPFDFYDRHRPIYTRSRFLPPSKIDGCLLEQVVVADGCRLNQAEFRECVIGLRSVVYPGVKLNRVVMLGADFYEDEEELAVNVRVDIPDLGIGPGCEIQRAIIDKNARIGKGVVIRSHEGEPDRDEEDYSIRDGYVVVAKDAWLHDGCVI
jgi:glucose-1-phosphate adenylyltransferase